MNVIFPVGKSMIESFWPSLVRDFVGVMYCVEVEDLSPTVTFETTVRSSAASRGARPAKSARASARARLRRCVMDRISFSGSVSRVSPLRGSAGGVDGLAERELAGGHVFQLRNLARRPPDGDAVGPGMVAQAEEEGLRAGGEERITGRDDL